jgi:hypothetical protein
VSAILPLAYNKHVVGMSLSILFYQMNNNTRNATHNDVHINKKDDTSNTINRRKQPSSCVVLGAGGCVLPMVISQLYPTCSVTAVELHPSVVRAARVCFGVSEYESRGSISLHTGCALEWLQSNFNYSNTKVYYN